MSILEVPWCTAPMITGLESAIRVSRICRSSWSTSTTFLTPANLGQRCATFCLFKILNVEPLKVALESKDLTLGLYSGLQCRSFRRQFSPQLESDFGQAAVGLSYRFEQVLSFVFGHVTPGSLCAPQRRRSKDLQDFIRSQTLIAGLRDGVTQRSDYAIIRHPTGSQGFCHNSRYEQTNRMSQPAILQLPEHKTAPGCKCANLRQNRPFTASEERSGYIALRRR